jgi:hypothetical protein
MYSLTTPAEVPRGPHYLLIVFETYAIHHEGDERSRVAPGHGYPAYGESVSTPLIYATEDKSEMLTRVRELHDRHAGKMIVLDVRQSVIPLRTLAIPGLEDH